MAFNDHERVEYAKSCEENVRILREQLHPLIHELKRLCTRSADRPEWTDVTDNWIANLQQTIATYESIIQWLTHGNAS